MNVPKDYTTAAAIPNVLTLVSAFRAYVTMVILEMA